MPILWGGYFMPLWLEHLSLYPSQVALWETFTPDKAICIWLLSPFFLISCGLVQI